MKMYVLVMLLASSVFVQAQNWSGIKVDDYSKGDKELVIFPFGMDQKITVGKIDSAGNVRLDWSGFDIAKLKNTDMYLSKYETSFDYYCDENTIEKGAEDAVQTVDAGYIYLWNGTRWVGAFVPASNPELKNHILDEGGKNAVPGSYLKWIYASGDASYYATCKESKFVFDAPRVMTTKKLQLDMKRGWNAVLFQIEEVADVKDAAAIPTMTTVSTIDGRPGDITWFVKGF